VEQAIGLMKNLQSSIVVEETWVEKQVEKLQSLPTATSARELDVSSQIILSLHISLLSSLSSLLGAREHRFSGISEWIKSFSYF
jgi:hypothetical protein